MSKKLPKNSHSSEEADIGEVFSLIGGAFDKLFKFFGVVFNKLFLGFVWLVFFLKKHFLKIIIAAVIGFGIAMIQNKISGSSFISTVTVKQNYNTGENLYDLIEYYNSLSSQKDSLALNKKLAISTSEAANILTFSIEPIVNENNRIKSYDLYIKTLDSTLASNIDYDMYINNTMLHDYTYQKILIETKQSRDMLAVFESMVNKINSSEFFKNLQERDLTELQNREQAIKEGLIESDSLKSTYKRVLEQTFEREKSKSSQTSITIEGSDKPKITKEFELYQNDLALRREIVEIQRQKQEKENVVEIVSSEFTSGVVDNSIEIFGKELNKKIVCALLFSLIAFFLLLSLEMNKFLDKFKSKI